MAATVHNLQLHRTTQKGIKMTASTALKLSGNMREIPLVNGKATSILGQMVDRLGFIQAEMAPLKKEEEQLKVQLRVTALPGVGVSEQLRVPVCRLAAQGASLMPPAARAAKNSDRRSWVDRYWRFSNVAAKSSSRFSRLG
jgi:hypothetical protein